MAYHKNIQSLLKEIEKDMTETMKNDVLENVKNTEQESIHEEVYNSYEPYQYQRRMENGGLSDQSNMIPNYFDINNGIQMMVKNLTTGKDQNMYLSPLIIHGDGYKGSEYQYKDNRDNTAYKYLQSRDFISDAIQDMQNTLSHVKAMREGLRKKGYKFYK